MPEYPDVQLYCERLRAFVEGHPLKRLRFADPFVLRTVDPRPAELHDRTVTGVENIGKRIVLVFEGDLFCVLHLMISGRLRWKKPGAAIPKKRGHAAFDFEDGSIVFTEASSRKRASIHVLRERDGLAEFDRGGLDVHEATLDAFKEAVTRERRTLKRGLTDPRILSQIGNAYSDEILHAARLSPTQLTTNLDDEELARLHEACKTTLTEWLERVREEVGDGFPDKVTAFRPGMAVHGRYGEPCPVCETEVQRIVYAENECNYCPRCQTGGRLLADRALSALLKKDWPRRIEDLEERRDGLQDQ